MSAATRQACQECRYWLGSRCYVAPTSVERAAAAPTCAQFVRPPGVKLGRTP